jgi:hypothetical protein
VYKIIKLLQKEEKDKAKINNTPKGEWVEHDKELWYDSKENIKIEEDKNLKNEIDLITVEELQNSLEKIKNKKATGPNGINAKLFKYGGEHLNNTVLNFINKCWQCARIPRTWYEDHVIPLFKK